MSNSKIVHLVCNTHLDPICLGNWEGSLTAVLANCRAAANFCESHEGFVFNHNEAALYQYVEEHDPSLFARIRELVHSGRWHIAGGAFLQSDVNHPSGESQIRHYLLGLAYFRDKFGLRPTTAWSADPFGHPEGLQQILVGCGMDSYIFCRTDVGPNHLPVGAFRWRCRSGAELLARRSDDHYLSDEDIEQKLARWLPHLEAEPESLLLWELGNHGVDHAELKKIEAYAVDHPDLTLRHSTPEAFFASVRSERQKLPLVEGEIRDSFAGCYTSMSRVKREHRRTEGLIAATERLAALAWWAGVVPYPTGELAAAWRNLLLTQCHNILPGTGVPQVERDALQRLGHVQQDLRRLRLRVLLPLLGGPPAKHGEVSIFIVNPHGCRLHTTVEVEYAIGDHGSPRHGEITLRRDGGKVLHQRLKPENNLNGTWFVRLAVPVDLRPWEIARYDAAWQPVPDFKPAPIPVTPKTLRIWADKIRVQINPRTGLIDSIEMQGDKSLVAPGAFCPMVFKDLDHSWVCGDPAQLSCPTLWSQAPVWHRPGSRFKLATAAEAAKLSPLAADKWRAGKRTAALPVRIIENGPVRTTVEVMFVRRQSSIIRHYIFEHKIGTLEIRDRIYCSHRDRLLALEVPLGFEPVESLSETVYSAVRREPTLDYEQRGNQRWMAVRAANGEYLAAINNGSFSHSLTSRVLMLNVLRTPAYASLNVAPGDPYNDHRFLPRQDQGEHEVRFVLQFGKRLNERTVAAAAAALNAPPYSQVFSPDGSRQLTDLSKLVTVNKASIEVVAVKRAEDGEALIVRLLDHGGRDCKVKVQVRGYEPLSVPIRGFGLQTVRIERDGQQPARLVSLVEDL